MVYRISRRIPARGSAGLATARLADLWRRLESARARWHEDDMPVPPLDIAPDRIGFALCGEALVARASGALHWPAQGLLCVADLHLGKAQRAALGGGAMLPPYEVRATLDRLAAELATTGARRVLALGDSFDDLGAAGRLAPDDRLRLIALMAGRDWVWITGNHDPAPLDLPGTHRAWVGLGALGFRHIARPGAAGEVTGHHHPKVRLPGGGSRPAFLIDARRAILPAFGAYAGGLDAADGAFAPLLAPDARALATDPGGRGGMLVLPARLTGARGRGKRGSWVGDRA
jgi:DNA ligase-associated metallophosphoesterase